MRGRHASGRIETEYRGFTISYSENEDVWNCYEVGMDGKTLTALKRKIDKHEATARRVDNFRAIWVRYNRYDDGGLTPVFITLICEPDRSQKPGGSDEGNRDVWVVPVEKPKKDSYDERERMKIGLDNLAVDTPESRAKIEAYLAAMDAEKKAEEAAAKAKAAIPRLTLKHLRQGERTGQGARRWLIV